MSLERYWKMVTREEVDREIRRNKPRKFPVLKGKPCLNVRPFCSQCKTKTPEDHNDFVAIMGGAMRVTDAKNKCAEIADDCIGFLSLHWHTHGPGMASVGIVDDTPRGQFDLYFCSTFCLRAFFNGCVDALEENIVKATKRDMKRRARKGK